MPYVEILAPPLQSDVKAQLARAITDGLTSAFEVGPQTVTLFFLPIAAGDYAHAGELGAQGGRQRILLKVHAFRRSTSARRAAAAPLTRATSIAYGAEGADVAIYFLDREKDEVAHDSRLASD
jgi:phenylpyruvate tautomerase PptA (4-oxalocrotonate tautomerase family)